MPFNLSHILIPPNSPEEKSYCKKYNIQLERLENGITIIGIPCRKDFTAWAQIKYDFSEGGYGNKPGSVHFLEHFINKKARPVALRNLLNIVAWTNPIEIGEDISGIANPKIKDFGIWPVLIEVRKALESPLNTVDDPLKTVETEKEVIKAEIKKKDTDHESQVYKHFLQKLYSPENPFYATTSVLGKEEDIDKLNLEILKDIQNKIMVGNNLLISFYTEGDLEIAKSITKKLKDLFLDFPSGKKNTLNKDLFDKINIETKPGETYSADPNIRNGIITTEFIWKFDYPFPSVKNFGLNLIASELKNELFAYSRKMGWGYVTNVYLTSHSDNLNFIRMRVDQRKNNQKELTPGIKEIIASVKKNTQALVDIENKRQLATPMNASNRLSFAVTSLKRHGSIIDADKIREIMLKTTAQDLNELIDQMLSIEPITLITGDLS